MILKRLIGNYVLKIQKTTVLWGRQTKVLGTHSKLPMVLWVDLRHAVLLFCHYVTLLIVAHSICNSWFQNLKSALYIGDLSSTQAMVLAYVIWVCAGLVGHFVLQKILSCGVYFHPKSPETWRLGSIFPRQHYTCLIKSLKFPEKSQECIYFWRKILRNGCLFVKMTLRNGYGLWVSSGTSSTEPNLK